MPNDLVDVSNPAQQEKIKAFLHQLFRNEITLKQKENMDQNIETIQAHSKFNIKYLNSLITSGYQTARNKFGSFRPAPQQTVLPLYEEKEKQQQSQSSLKLGSSS